MKRTIWMMVWMMAMAACGSGTETGNEVCKTDADCPAKRPGDCERWACSSDLQPQSGAKLGCQPIPLDVDAPCDNGNPVCTGTCLTVTDGGMLSCVVTAMDPMCGTQ